MQLDHTVGARLSGRRVDVWRAANRGATAPLPWCRSRCVTATGSVGRGAAGLVWTVRTEPLLRLPVAELVGRS